MEQGDDPTDGVSFALTGEESRTIHEPKRLKILTVLQETKGLHLSALQEILGLAPNDLSHHLGVLAGLGMVEISRPLRGDARYKSVELTQRGRVCFLRYRDEMLRLLD